MESPSPELIEQARTCVKARTRLIEMVIPLIRFVLRKGRLDPNKYLGQATLYLIKILPTYNPKKGKFTSYLSHFLVREMLREEQLEGGVISVSRHSAKTKGLPKLESLESVEAKVVQDSLSDDDAEKLLSYLSKDSKEVLTLHCRGMKYVDIARAKGVSKGRIEQLRNEAAAHLRSTSSLRRHVEES